jgi:hypothetical protein
MKVVGGRWLVVGGKEVVGVLLTNHQPPTTNHLLFSLDL